MPGINPKKEHEMKRHLLLCILSLFAALPLCAQSAKSLLEKAENAFVTAPGIEAQFTLRYVNQGGGLQKGNISLKNKKFKLSTEGTTTWFDGKTQWTYVQANDEVNVSEPDESELEAINPYAFISFYKKGYKLKNGTATQANGHQVYEVDMLAEKKTQDIWQVVLMLDKSTYQPVQIKIRQKNDQWFILNITSFTKKSLADSYFTFQKSDAPNAEIIDLR